MVPPNQLRRSGPAGTRGRHAKACPGKPGPTALNMTVVGLQNLASYPAEASPPSGGGASAGLGERGGGSGFKLA